MASKTQGPSASLRASAGTPRLPDDYPELVARIKHEIAAGRTRAALAVNEELIQLYWRIGSEILGRQQHEGWATKVIERLSTDLRREFPEMSGLSVRNLKYMRSFAESWPSESIVQRAVAQLPWGHNIVLLQKLDAAAERELAQQILHEDYNLEFLDLAEDAGERSLERSLVKQINFYVNVVDDTLRAEHHDPTIGLVLCASRNRTVARYALQGIRGPIGIARYNTTPALLEHVPEEMRDQLPHTAQISAGVQQIVDRHHGKIDDTDA